MTNCIFLGTKESQKQKKKSKPADEKPSPMEDSTDESDLENDSELNDLVAAAKRNKPAASNSKPTASNSKPTAEISTESDSVTKRKTSKRQATRPVAKETSPKKTNSPARLTPKNKSKKESPVTKAADKTSTNQKRGINGTRTRLDSPMAKISIDEEKENKRSSPRKRNRDSSSGSQSSSSQSSQVKINPRTDLSRNRLVELV